MHSVISLKLFTHLFLYFSLVNALELFFYNDIADTPQETIEFESGSLFYTGVLPHIKSFTCTADNINTETVTWYDTSGNEVPMGTGASSTLYWTGVGGNKTLHTSNNAGTDFISVANQGNNFTCRVNGTAQVKYFGIYWVRPILSNANTIQTDLRGFRIYTKNTPPVISEFTLQRGLFNFDFNKLYKVQSMKGSSNITFRPDMVTYSASSIPSIIDNVTFSNTSVCQSIGTSDSDELYTTISDRAFFNYEPGNFANPRLSNSLCIENGTIGPSVLTIGNTSPDIRYTCPLVYNGEFIDIEDFSIDTVNSNVTTVNASLNLNENRRRLWIDFTASNPITLIYDREYICEDMYGTRLSFRLIVNGNNPLEVFDSNFATFGVTNSTNYISNSIPNTLYCLSMSSTLEVTWYFDNIANRSQFISSAQVTSNSSYLPYIDTPRTGRSDLFLNETIRSETEGYYTCSDNINEVRIGVFLQELVAPVVNASSLSIPIDTPINITCGVSNFPYPPALYYWTGRNPSSTSLLDTTGFTEADSGFYTCHATNVVGADEMTINISIIPAPPVLVASNLTVMDFYFEEDPFQLSCTFSTNPNPLSPLLISWYKDNMLIMDGSNGVQIQTMSTETNTNHSVLSVASAVPANAGQYSCRALIGASNPAMSGIANVVVEASYQPDVVSIELGRIGSVSAELSWNGTNRNRTAPETYVVSYCELPKCNSYTQSPSLVTTSYHLTGLRSLSNYSVFVIATNRYGSTDGANKNLSTLLERVLLFKGSRRYMGSNEDVYFASGSIFRGVNIDVGFPIRQFFCTYDPSTDTIEWYTPNGDLIPLNGPSSSFYHTINSGESTLHIGNHVSAENEGRNFTCRINSSGFIQDHFFGLYYMLTDLVTTTNYVGERIYSTSVPPLVRELTLQRGTFDFDYDMLYEIQSLQADLADYNWKFNPPLEQPQVVNDSLRLLTAVKFSNSSICQIGTSQYQPYFFSISNKPFILKTTPRDGIAGLLYLQASCIENNSTAYVYRIGEGVDIGVTCPLFFNATFLDTSDIIQLNYTINRNNPRRFFVDPSKTLAMVKHDREYICEDKYGTRASFKARVDANAPIQVFDTDSTITPTNNDTMYFVTEVTLYCLSDSVSNGVVWYSDTNPNSTLPRTYTPVSDNVTAQPYVSNPRNGRSDLVVRPDQSSYQEGYFYCQDSMNRVMFYSIFTQQPIVPSAQIIPNVSTLQLVIGASSPLTCGHTNSPHPSAISYWTGTMTSIIYTSQLLESDSRIYTCTSSNVFGYTSASISIIVIPPPPQNIDLLQPINSTNIFVTDIFQLSCQFETFSNVSSSFLIQWYHNNDLNILFPNTININENIATSTLTVTNSSFQQAGDYHCVATVGGSSPTNSTNISVSINPITLPNPINVTITDSELRNVNVSWTLSIQFPSLTETYTLVYQRVGDSSYQTTNTLNSTSFTLTGLLFNSQYKVYINATNRFGTTQGSDNTFSTEQVRLYFMRDGEIVQFASGSIFRGGTHSIVSGGVFQFYCVPDSPDQEITWYAPNGDIIPAGPLIPSLYHIRDVNTGESVLYTNNSISTNTEGNNYTCSFNLSSGPVSVSNFGIYYVQQDNNYVFGIRLYGPGNIIYEFVYQIGSFNIDFSSKYDIECLDPSNQPNQWEFQPNLLSESSRTNTLITQAQFNPNATCQYIICKPSVQYPVFSNKPFFLQTNQTIGQPNCRPNNYAYEFNLGSPIELHITCPLIFGARFLDISNIEVIQNEYTIDTSRRLFFNSTATLALLALERNFTCVDTQGASVSFSIRVLSNQVIQLLDSEDSDSTIGNGTILIGANIPNSIFCITQASGNSANWFVDSNQNRSLNEAPMQVNTNTATFPYTTNPRVGRSNLILNGTIGSGNEGFYSCVTNPTITVGIFAQTPVLPTATISPDQTTIQVIIGTNAPVLTCQNNNSSHPPPIYFWTGSISSTNATLDTNLFIESDSGVYTCIASNVFGMSTDTVNITVIPPPPPQFISSQLVPTGVLFVSDTFELSCRFETILNITHLLSIQWHHNGMIDTSPSTTSLSGNITTSTLTITASSLQQAGDYHCVATVGGSPTNSTNISVSINPITLPNPINVTITDSELRNVNVSWTLSIQFPSLTETYTLVYQRVGDSSYQTTNTHNSTSFTLTGLLFNSQYRVYINATNRFGTTQGPDNTFSTEQVRLYSMRDGEIVQFASGSIFRGGTHSIVSGGVFQFYCVPDSPDQEITWYAPNGDVIPAGPLIPSLYHIRDVNTGESVLYTNNIISANTEGNNYTCSFNLSSGTVNVSTFGIYYVGQDNNDVFGIRLYGPGNIIYEFVYQIGSFNIDLSSKYDIECLDPSNQLNQWEFQPNLLFESSRNNTLITQAQFDSNATCQYISCKPSVQYPVFSNKPFFLQTNQTIGQPNCRPNNYAYEFNLGSPIELYITCPLIFGARFLDISNIEVIQNEYTIDTSRRLFFNSTATLALLALERNFTCVDTQGASVSFSIRVLSNQVIQLLDSEDSDSTIGNGTDLIGTNIPNSIFCITQASGNSANWFVDSNQNRSLNEAPMQVNTNTATFPYTTNPRVGRSNLILNGTIGVGNEGFYSCVTNPTITVGIFSQTPVVPTATISPDQTTIQVIIGTNAPVLTCQNNNSSHPPPIYFWTGSISSTNATLDTNLFIESDSGVYTCIASNVFGMSTDTVNITVIPPPPPQFISSQLVPTGVLFVSDTFELSCRFETILNITHLLSIQWHHNGMIDTSPSTTSLSGNITTSTLAITASSLQQAGDYHCVATVGGSPINSTPISVTINPITLPNPISVTITDSELRNANVSWTPIVQFPSLTETYTLVYQRVGDSSYQTTNTHNSTSFTLTGLLFNSQYRVYINATNRFGTTQGPDNTFSTEQVRLYFIRDGEIVQFASGSIFRGGAHIIVSGGVFQFYCVPDSPDQEITWYAPNGDVIPAGPLIPSLYHIRDVNTGESVLYTNNIISTNTEGNNYTCSFNLSSGTVNVSTFGIYYVGQDNNDVFGIRLYGPGNIIYEFVYQIGSFNIDLSSKYDIECLDPSNQPNQWEFQPNLLSESSRTNTLITQAQFNPNATCQYISCKPSVQYPVFSNKPFFLQTNQTIGQPNCRPNNYAYEFNLGSPIELYITCPLIFGARFLDISNIEVIQNEYTIDTSRRLFFNSTATLALLALERNFTCVNTQGASVSFSIRVLSNEVIQLLDSEDSDSTIGNGTDLIGSNIPNTIFCITQASGNSANWFVDSIPNRSFNEAPMLLNTNSATFPYATNPRVGRSNLILNGTIGSGNEGFYSCVTNPRITVGIFAQTPVVPTATISPDQTMVQVVIGTNTPVLNCLNNNSPHPPPIYFWTGSINSSTAILDTNLLLESDSGVYTCTASNVLGMSIDTVTITVIPPPPQFNTIQISPQTKIYINDDVILQCQFSTFQNITSEFIVEWYKDGINISNTANITLTINGNTIAMSTLTLSNSQVDEEGDYYCQARVGDSQLSVSNNQTLNFDPPPNPMYVQLISMPESPYLTQDTQLQCQFSTLPRFQAMLRITWYHNSTIMLNNANGIQIIESNVSTNQKESTLKITNLSFFQAGDYHCVGGVEDVLNSGQNNSTVFTVNVLMPPAPSLVGNIYTENEDILIGQAFSIFCQFMTLEYFIPTLEINWFHNDTILQNNTSIVINTVEIGTKAKNSSLTITSAQVQQSGTYECRSNIVSSPITKDSISISITEPSTTQSTSQSTTPQSTIPQSVTDFIPVIAGVFIALLFIIVLILIFLLILLIICRRRNKNRASRGLPDVLLKRHRKNRLRSTNSNKQLVTPTSSLGLNLDISYVKDKQYRDEELIEGATTFRKSGSFQETMLTNISAEGAMAEPLYEDFTFENYSIPIAIFPQKILDYHLANNAEFERQYSTIRKTFIHDVSTGSHINNKPKNRFANIIPYEHSRVKLTFTGEYNSDYINACYLDGYYNRQAYIASQGPMPHTLNDFWRMIWEKNIEHIVALTKVMEAAKKKCEQYWPENENDMCEFDMIQVTLKKCERYTSYDIRKMEITHAEYPTDVRVVIQFHYTVWPDHGVPIFSSSLISFINHTKEYHVPKKTQPPMLVHCSAGVGRTGTFIVLDYFLEHLKENDKVNIYRLVAQLRENRCLMVQTKDQYIFIHDALLDVICCKDTFIADHEFQAYLDNAMIRSLESMSTPFEDQYELIMKTSRIVDERDVAEASDLANVMKNRFPNFVPFDSHRVTVIPDQDGDKDYVNASFVHSYQKHKGFIAAQGPLQHTTYDFWKLITKYRIQFIIMLSDLDEGGHEMCAKYWPEEGQEILVQYLVISCEKEEIFDSYIKRKLVVTTQQGGLNQSIQQVQFKKWHYNEQPDVKDLMVLYHQFTYVQRAIKSKELSPILVHCDNGSTRTGTFIACVNAIQQLELERKVDIFQIVRNLRNSRPCMVPSLDLYILCFKLVACYIRSYEEKAYANFM